LEFGMSTSRGSRLTLSLLAILWIASTAHAQEPGEPSAVMRLVAQTAWTTPEKPLLRIVLRISNNGDTAIAGPVVVWTLGSRVTSRVEYETALDEGPDSIASADTILLPGDLAAGESMEVPIRIDSAETGGIVQDDSGVYPLQLDLRSEEDRSIATVTTAAIHIFQPPQKPVLFSWWTEVATPVAFGPDGSLIDPGFEAALGSHGGIVAQVDALADLSRARPAGAPIDLIVSPAALDQLRQAEDGFVRSDGTTVPADAPAAEAAAETLDLLREIANAPGARLHAMPFAAPRLPELQSARLGAHLEQQWRMGDQTFEQILEEPPDPTVTRPPGLVFDQASVDLLEARGATTILGAADSVDRPRQLNDYAPPPAATLSTTSGSNIELLLPDPGAQALLGDAELLADPVRAAQVVLGELATIWKEEPVPPPDEYNGLALDLPPDLPTAFWAPAVRRLSRAPFLEPVHAEDLPGGLQPPPDLVEVDNPSPAGFSTLYENDLAATGRRLAAFGAILEEPAGEVDLLRRSLLYAEASQYIGNEGSGQVWIHAVDRVIDRTFSRLRPDTSRVLTFTSRSGTIPLRMGDPGDRVLNVKVELESGRVDFLDDNIRNVRLDQANQVITFQVEVKAAGPSNIDVSVTSPNGAVLSRSVLVVRSTAVNPIALIITIGAGLVLVGLWSRRLFRRRHA
jgi:hypothetical protein